MKLPKSKLGFLLAAVYIFIAGLFFIYARFACNADALYCGTLGPMSLLPTLLFTVSLNIFSSQPPSDFMLSFEFILALLVNTVLLYFIGLVIQNKFSQKTAKIISLLAISVAVIVVIILGIRYFNRSDIWKPNIPVNVNNPINSRNYCQQDSDCVLAPQYQDCCPKGCEIEAVNMDMDTKNRNEEARNKQYNCNLKKISCPRYKCISSVGKQAVCEQNRCVVKEKQQVNTNTQSIATMNYKIIGSFTSPGESSFVKVLGSTAYLTDISEGLLAIDVSNPEKPVLLDKIKIAGGGAYALAVNLGDFYAMVSGYGNSKIARIDIRDPKNLRIVNEIDAKRTVQDMVAIANRVYLAIDGPEVEVLGLNFDDSLLELSIPKTFISEGVFQIQGGGHAIGLTTVNKAGSLTHYYLLIAQGERGVGIYEKSESIMPQFNYAAATFSIGYVSIVAVDEKYVYAGVGNAIKVIDIKTQKEIADIKVDDVWNFKVKNNMLYVASGENGVQVLDISDIKNPKQIAVIDTPGRARSIDVSVDGKYIYVADDRDDLQIIKAE